MIVEVSEADGVKGNLDFTAILDWLYSRYEIIQKI